MTPPWGGDWTQVKLEPIQRYLTAYTTALKNQPFKRVYIDAFAGTGYREQTEKAAAGNPLFPDLAEQDFQRFIEGSARIALQVQPEFDKYFFIEQDPNAFKELERLKADFPDKADRIELRNEDANEWLRKACSHTPFWRKHRAVAFLDPFGMQVKWPTIEAIANTQAIDLWVLFPLGVAVNRLLTKDLRKIKMSHKKKLNDIFGTSEWERIFYEAYPNFFGEARHKKVVNLEDIGRYYNERLSSIFRGVAKNPKPLHNSKGNPLFLLCFAVSNPRAVEPAIRIAQHILGS